MALPFANKPQKIPTKLTKKKHKCFNKYLTEEVIYYNAILKNIPISGVSPKEVCKELERISIPPEYLRAQEEFIDNLTPFERNIIYTYTTIHPSINSYLRFGSVHFVGILFSSLIFKIQPSLNYLAKKNNFNYKLNKNLREGLIKEYNEDKYGKAKDINEMITNIQKIAKDKNKFGLWEMTSWAGALPSKSQIKQMNNILSDFVKIFCGIFNKAPEVSKPFRVFRGINVPNFKSLLEKNLIDKGIISTSLDVSFARLYSHAVGPYTYPVNIFIDMPKGSKGVLIIDQRTNNEPSHFEFLLAPNTTFISQNSFFNKEKVEEYIHKSGKSERIIKMKSALNLHLIIEKNGCETSKPFKLPNIELDEPKKKIEMVPAIKDHIIKD